MKKYFYLIIAAAMTFFILLIWKSKVAGEEGIATPPEPETPTEIENPPLPPFVNDVNTAEDIYGHGHYAVRQVYGKYYYYPSTTSFDEVLGAAKIILEKELAEKNLKIGDEMAEYSDVALPNLPPGVKWKKQHRGGDGHITLKIVSEDEQLAPSGWGLGSKFTMDIGSIHNLPEILPMWTWLDKVTPVQDLKGFNVYEVTAKSV